MPFGVNSKACWSKRNPMTAEVATGADAAMVKTLLPTKPWRSLGNRLSSLNNGDAQAPYGNRNKAASRKKHRLISESRCLFTRRAGQSASAQAPKSPSRCSSNRFDLLASRQRQAGRGPILSGIHAAPGVWADLSGGLGSPSRGATGAARRAVGRIAWVQCGRRATRA
jgi:hypothetical protein